MVPMGEGRQGLRRPPSASRGSGQGRLQQAPHVCDLFMAGVGQGWRGRQAGLPRRTRLRSVWLSMGVGMAPEHHSGGSYYMLVLGLDEET